jgi:hypothetical protein
MMAALLASSVYAPLLLAQQQIDGPCQDLTRRIEQRLIDFLANPLTPLSFLDFETDLRQILDEAGRQVLEIAANSVEPERPEDSPKHACKDNLDYSRKNHKTPNRNGIASTFGVLQLSRCLYEPLQDARDQGKKSFAPVELDLGLVAANATPALAWRLGLLAAEHSQQQLLDVLARDHHVHWSVATLRQVTQAISEGIEPHLLGAQAEQLLDWLKQADNSKGRRKIVFSVGRDGLMLPMRREKTHKEGSVATLSVFDRRGRRLGTAYLGAMPQPGQTRLTKQLTELLREVLRRWQGPSLRLAYVTDAGPHQENYFEAVLAKMEDPRHPGKRLEWVRIVDFYHAASYLTKLAEVLFQTPSEKKGWTHRMRHLLLEDENGWKRLLSSAGYYRGQRQLSKSQEKEYKAAYGYLRRHGEGMKYAWYKRQGLPRGSGITEAGCKIVFSQRFKRSGMKWSQQGGEAILALRVACLSGIYTCALRRWLASRPVAGLSTSRLCWPDPACPGPLLSSAL